MGFIPSFFFALKSDEHPMRLMLLVAMWCKCDVMCAPTREPGPTPSVGHVTGDMKRRESNETLIPTYGVLPYTMISMQFTVGSSSDYSQ